MRPLPHCGCRADDHWSERQQAARLRSAVSFREPNDGGSSAASQRHADTVRFVLF